MDDTTVQHINAIVATGDSAGWLVLADYFEERGERGVAVTLRRCHALASRLTAQFDETFAERLGYTTLYACDHAALRRGLDSLSHVYAGVIASTLVTAVLRHYDTCPQVWHQFVVALPLFRMGFTVALVNNITTQLHAIDKRSSSRPSVARTATIFDVGRLADWLHSVDDHRASNWRCLALLISSVQYQHGERDANVAWQCVHAAIGSIMEPPDVRRIHDFV